ncbi:MAG: hypothetical protein R3F49_19205 [Planctomycetota bacterium]
MVQPNTDPSANDRGSADGQAAEPAVVLTRGPRGPGPLVLLAPITALLAFALWRQSVGADLATSRHAAEVPPLESGQMSVDGWSASFAWGAGGLSFLVDARLAPLHAEAKRQSFDAHALRERFGLGPGEPMRLTLRAAQAPSSGGAPAGAGAAPASLELSLVTVEGLAPIVLSAPTGASEVTATEGTATEGAPHDPVAALFAPPHGALAPGQEVDLYLWRPASEPEGPRSATPAARTLRIGGKEATRLVPTRLEAPRTSSSLARVDASAGVEGSSQGRAPR